MSSEPHNDHGNLDQSDHLDQSDRVDAHHHVWNLDVRDEPWIVGAAMAPIRRNFDLAELETHTEPAGVSATVLVQTLSDVDETKDFLQLAANSPLVTAVTGWVPLDAPDVVDQLTELRAGVGGSRLRGIRHQVHDEPDPEWLCRSEVRRGLAAVGDLGLIYELLTFTAQLPAAIRTVAELSDVRFVLDHCSKPPIASGELEPWASQLRELAAHPNVSCKLSGLVTEANWSEWTVDDLRPYVDVVLDAFGPERLMWGSDWPVSLLAAQYGRWVSAADELTNELSPDERSAIFAGTARLTYDLD